MPSTRWKKPPGLGAEDSMTDPQKQEEAREVWMALLLPYFFGLVLLLGGLQLVDLAIPLASVWTGRGLLLVVGVLLGLGGLAILRWVCEMLAVVKGWWALAGQLLGLVPVLGFVILVLLPSRVRKQG
jgi:hypothetical protein